jgi:CRISPR-associated protein Cmr6
MPADTKAVLGPNAEKCDSRSLLLDRLVDPTADDRKAVFAKAREKTADGKRCRDWLLFVTEHLGVKLEDILIAQLQSRLMVNMAGGAMENAGLCIDRFGVPYIPGSAVKGCARRMALASLREWSETGGQPENKPTGDDNPCAAACALFGSPAEMLVSIARVFGWCDQDWKDGSDLAWACAHDRQTTWERAATALCRAFGWKIPEKFERTPWKTLGACAGFVSFLPAYPIELGDSGELDGLPLKAPPLGQLELDVVTCHHREYYAGKNPDYASAPDTEDPVPVVFPAVAPGHAFGCVLLPIRHSSQDDLRHARRWLAGGLRTFGLGAKTNAGYGWFDCSERVQNVVRSEWHRLVEESTKAREEARAKLAAAAAAAKAQQEEQERLAKAPPADRFRAQYAKLADEPFAEVAKKYAQLSEEQRHGFILALKAKRDTVKRWAKKKPELLQPWLEHARKLQPPIQLP